jgi:mannose-1-phosphate guanylyltransferase
VKSPNSAGPLSLARDILGKDDSPFFVLNSDVICEFPFKSLLDFHQSHGAEGTLMTTPVEDPSKYGVVCLKAGTTQIERFVEKPQNWVGDQINAGIYIFNPKILSRIRHVLFIYVGQTHVYRKGRFSKYGS